MGWRTLSPTQRRMNGERPAGDGGLHVPAPSSLHMRSGARGLRGVLVSAWGGERPAEDGSLHVPAFRSLQMRLYLLHPAPSRSRSSHCLLPLPTATSLSPVFRLQAPIRADRNVRATLVDDVVSRGAQLHADPHVPGILAPCDGQRAINSECLQQQMRLGHDRRFL
jgi:hypothetical protein